MGKVLAITNRKGGTGKSTTSISLWAGLARLGKKVLIIDADSQHSATVSLFLYFLTEKNSGAGMTGGRI